jgi:hypothetical protein
MLTVGSGRGAEPVCVTAPPRVRGGRRAVVSVAAAALLFQLFIYDRWISFMDEGHMLQFAALIADGGDLYRDATVYPLPGAFYALAGIFRVVGASILVARWVVVIEFTLLAIFVLLLLRRFVPVAWSGAGLLLLFLYRVWAFPHWHMYSYTSTALCLLAGALVLLLRFLETADLRVVALAGLAAGIGGVCRQDYGAATLLAMNLVLIVRARAVPAPPGRGRLVPLWCFNGPPLAVAAMTLAYFWHQGLLAELVRQTFWNHLVGMATFDYPSLPSIFPLFRQNPALSDAAAHVVYMPPIIGTVDFAALRESFLYRETALWDVGLETFFYAPYVLALVGAVRLWRRRSARLDPSRRLGYLRELTLTSFAVALLLSLNKPRDYVHVAVLYWPFLCLLLVYAHALVFGRRWRAAIAVAVALGVGVPAVGYTARLVWLLRSQHSELLPTDRAQVYVKPAEAQVIGDVVRYIGTHSGHDDDVLVLPYFPLLSFLADRRGPHRSGYVVWPVPDYPDRDRRIIEATEEAGVDVVIYSFTQWPQFPPFERYAPELFTYLVEHFELDRVFSPDPWGYVLAGLRRETRAPAGRPLLGPDGSGGALRIEGPGAATREVPESERAQFLSTTLWPFRPVVVLRPLAGDRRTVLSVPVAVAGGSRLRTAIGVHPGRWVDYPPLAVTFTVTANDGGQREVLFSRRLDPQGHVADRRWVEVDVPLDSYAGRMIDLQFSTSCERPEAETLDMAGYAIPRLITSPHRSAEGS